MAVVVGKTAKKWHKKRKSSTAKTVVTVTTPAKRRKVSKKVKAMAAAASSYNPMKYAKPLYMTPTITPHGMINKLIAGEHNSRSNVPTAVPDPGSITVPSIQRFTLKSDTNADMYLVLQYTPTNVRGVFIRADTSVIRQVVVAPNMTASSTPQSIRPGRLTLHLRCTTQLNTVQGFVRVLNTPTTFDWSNNFTNLTNVAADDSNGLGVGLVNSPVVTAIKNACNDLMTKDPNTKTITNRDLLSTKFFASVPVDTNEWHRFDNFSAVITDGGAQGNYDAKWTSGTYGMKYALQDGAEKGATSTVIVMFPKTADTVQSWDMAIHSHDVVRYPMNSTLGQMMKNVAATDPKMMNAMIESAQRLSLAGYTAGDVKRLASLDLAQLRKITG
jgi:hypothetical protein